MNRATYTYARSSFDDATMNLNSDTQLSSYQPQIFFMVYSAGGSGLVSDDVAFHEHAIYI